MEKENKNVGYIYCSIFENDYYKINVPHIVMLTENRQQKVFIDADLFLFPKDMFPKMPRKILDDLYFSKKVLELISLLISITAWNYDDLPTEEMKEAYLFLVLIGVIEEKKERMITHL